MARPSEGFAPGRRGDRLGHPVTRAACLAVALAAGAMGPLSTGGGRLGAVIGFGLSVAVFGFCAVVVSLRAARPAADELMWRWLSVAVALLGVGALVEAGGRLTAALGGTPWLPEGAALLVLLVPALSASWASLVHRRRGRHDAGEYVNGVGGLILTTASALLLLALLAPDTYRSLPAWRLHLTALLAGTLVVTVAALFVIGAVSRPLARASLWGLGLGFSPVILAIVRFGLTGHGLGTLVLLWTIPVVLTTVVATLPERPLPDLVPRISSTWFVVGLLALAILLLGVAALSPLFGLGVPGGIVAPVLYVLVGAACVSGRGVQLVRDLASLAETRQQALTDELTGLANRRSLLRELEAATGRAGSDVALLIADLDGFATVNGRFGHAAGDEALREVAATLVGAAPSGTLVARLGGDEFAVLLPGCAEGAAVEVARHLHDVVEARLAADHRFAPVGISIGVAGDGYREVGAPDLRPGDLLRRADTALSRAKGDPAGVGLYDAEADERARDQAVLLGDLTAMFADATRLEEELVVFYQPQLAAGETRVVGVEALVRWRHPERGILPPMDFLTMVEDNGLMAELSFHVLRRAVTEAAGWSCDGVPLRISVNLSTSTLVHPDLLLAVEDALEVGGLVPGRLVLEVTETTLMSDPDTALEITRRLTSRGVQLSIDDYGTGYSSLAYLTDLPASELKLDRAFTRRLLAEPRTTAIVAATVALSHRLGLRVVAEGVEDADTLRVLARLGADESQGFLHSRPLPPTDFAAWLSAQPGGNAATRTAPATARADRIPFARRAGGPTRPLTPA
ncbi:putative bifunctional diguanylate cyclase/phosphodiesterase [Kineococcus gynurae]|uniref:Bifunctional diguanylate cyclase/phosphodiesterase n=1 Tax=Kineococcus gynurae TaxID=452979 RepID=A0ABV5LSW5_9ACTN